MFHYYDPKPKTDDVTASVAVHECQNCGTSCETLHEVPHFDYMGCDDCLEACPWNRFARESRETAFRARQSTTGMSLREYLDLTDAEFRMLFQKSPIKRIKRRGFLRNVCVALGNVGDSSDLPALVRAAADPEPLIAEHASWAIQRIRDRQKQGRPQIV